LAHVAHNKQRKNLPCVSAGFHNFAEGTAGFAHSAAFLASRVGDLGTDGLDYARIGVKTSRSECRAGEAALAKTL
jgi:hypothetical protein